MSISRVARGRVQAASASPPISMYGIDSLSRSSMIPTNATSSLEFSVIERENSIHILDTKLLGVRIGSPDFFREIGVHPVDVPQNVYRRSRIRFGMSFGPFPVFVPT